MKRLLTFVAMLLFIACNNDELYTPLSKTIRFHATIESEETRTFVDENIRLRWTAEDLITLFEATTRNKKYKFLGKTGDNAGDFEDVTTGFGSGNNIDRYYALYPYASTTKLHEDGYITYTFPVEQTYAENTFGLGANPMVAVTEDLNDYDLSFKNAGAYLRLYLYGEDITIKSIKIEGNNAEPIAGKAIITPVYGGNPTIEMDATATTAVTLNCCEGVSIGSTAETSTPFWIVLPPTEFEEGLTITVTNNNDEIFIKSFSSKINIKRNQYISAMVGLEDMTPYITFSADKEQTLTMSKAVNSLEYSTNNGEWSTLETSTVSFGGNIGNLRLRGKSNTGTATSASTNGYSTICFGNEEKVSCTGDIRTLIDYENYTTVETGKARFCYLFYNCNCLTSAPSLPSINLATQCYKFMFQNCTELTCAPSLPATTMYDECYGGMFWNCTNLLKAPELPATILDDRCYYYMFYGCTSLIDAPALPALNLSQYCYHSMFEGCTSLTNPPRLPATTLTDYCYAYMFFGCTNISASPFLSASILTEGCYWRMFSNCSNLNYITMLATDIDAPYCLDSWVSGVSTSGSFTKSGAMTSLTVGNSGIPNGWKVDDYGSD